MKIIAYILILAAFFETDVSLEWLSRNFAKTFFPWSTSTLSTDESDYSP